MTEAPDLIPLSLRALWQDAARLIVFVLSQFSRDHIRTGIRRTTGARLSMWLNGAESALRRLIMMAALALTPTPIKPQRPSEPHARTKPPHRSFRVFSLYGSGASRPRSGWSPAREPVAYAHINFRADPILALGRMPTRRPTHRHNGGPLLPRQKLRNPLDRWMRLSRNDPDWRPPEPPFNPFDYNVIPEPRPEDAPPRKRKPLQRCDSTADWRRHHDEWQKLVPAPTLAARLDALERAMAMPEALIRRTARRLQSNRDCALPLAREAWPSTDPPRRARHIQIDDWGRAVCEAVHAAAWRAFDSS